jgi:hypothetical protein
MAFIHAIMDASDTGPSPRFTVIFSISPEKANGT